jgi:hypothetical protein
VPESISLIKVVETSQILSDGLYPLVQRIDGERVIVMMWLFIRFFPRSNDPLEQIPRASGGEDQFWVAGIIF